MSDNICFGTRLKARRVLLGISQRDLSDMIGVSVCLVGLWESRSVVPSEINLKYICRALDVVPSFFGFGDSVMDIF
jgi:transcriptional regulator with XRE-family HTH domain